MKLIENIIQIEFDSSLEVLKPLSGGSINNVYLIEVLGVFSL